MMNKQSIATLLSTTFTLLGSSFFALAAVANPGDISQANPTPRQEPDVIVQPQDDPRFTCEAVGGQYTVFYHPKDQQNQAYAWAVPQDLGGGWSAQKRCTVISQRLEQYRPDGLVELQTGQENNYNTVCVTTQADPSCRIVLTVPPGQDPEMTRNSVFQNLTVADSGQQTQGVLTFGEQGGNGDLLQQLGQVLGVDPSSLGLGNLGNLGGNTNPTTPGAIDLRPFLSPADGGTGQFLRPQNSSVRPVAPAPSNSSGGNRLNPDRFR